VTHLNDINIFKIDYLRGRRTEIENSDDLRSTSSEQGRRGSEREKKAHILVIKLLHEFDLSQDSLRINWIIKHTTDLFNCHMLLSCFINCRTMRKENRVHERNNRFQEGAHMTIP
jgi:hypothetical protein